MIVTFSGDPFLAVRAARALLQEWRKGGADVVELGEGMTADEVSRHVQQGGLFGPGALYLDFDAAFKGQAGVRPRNELLRLLPGLPADVQLAVVDLEATESRKKTYREVGRLEHLPTPRFGALTGWIRSELKAAGVQFTGGVPEELAELFGEDLPAIASEITKLSLLDEKFTVERVREVSGKTAVRDAFDLIEAISEGDAVKALQVCRALTDQGEAGARILAALSWQYTLVARCVGLRESRGRVDQSAVMQVLGVKPFVARKALGIAAKLDEGTLRRVLLLLAEADQATKQGRNEAWALELLTLNLVDLFS
jgi:DNA polymerase-3 subunit delta